MHGAYAENVAIAKRDHVLKKVGTKTSDTGIKRNVVAPDVAQMPRPEARLCE